LLDRAWIKKPYLDTQPVNPKNLTFDPLKP